jgi:hypothetical protein
VRARERVGRHGPHAHLARRRRGVPATFPTFVRTPAAVDEIAALGPELDRSKDAGATHDRDLDPGHYADVGDDDSIFGVPLAALPETREAYDTALRTPRRRRIQGGLSCRTR